MRVKTVIILFILSLSISIPAPSNATVTLSSVDLPITVFDVENETPTYYAVDIPWFYQEHSGSCGAAALKSVFGQLGYSIDEGEIRSAAQTTSTTTLTGDMVRAAHFSNASEEGSGTVIQGYTGKSFGTDSYERGFDGYSPGGQDAAEEFLKQRLLEGKPVILLMSYRSGGSLGHFRVLRGYDDRTGRYIFTDSLGSNPNAGSHWTMTATSLFDNYWDYSGYWAQVITPWIVTLSPTQNPIPGGVFGIGATIDSGVPSGTRFVPWSLENASIRLNLPSGYSLSSGSQVTVFGFNSSGMAQVSWQIQAPLTIENDHVISAGVTGWINGTGTHPWQVDPFDYCDITYSEMALNLVDWIPPEIIGLNVSKDQDGFLIVHALLTDDNSLQNISLQWRMSATNWTNVDMDYIGGSLWQVTGISPVDPSGDEIIQFRVQAQDNFDNELTSSVYECAYTFTTITPTTTPTDTETTTTGTEPTPHDPNEIIPLAFIAGVAIGFVALIVIVVIYRQRGGNCIRKAWLIQAPSCSGRNSKSNCYG